MNSNALGIVAVTVVALGALGLFGLQSRKPKTTASFVTSGSTMDTFGAVVQLTNDEWDKIAIKVLKASSKFPPADRDKLYRVRHFTAGIEDPPSPTPVLPPGSPPPPDSDSDLGHLPLEDLLFDRDATIDAITHAKPAKFTGFAFQIGLGGGYNYQRTPSSAVAMPQGHGKQNMRESREMVTEVNEELEKQ